MRINNIKKVCLFFFLSASSALGADNTQHYHPLQSPTKTNKSVKLPEDYQQSRNLGPITLPKEIFPIVFDQDLQPPRITEIFHGLLFKLQDLDCYPSLTVGVPQFAMGERSSELCSKAMINLVYYCINKGHCQVDKIPFSAVRTFFDSYDDLLNGITYEFPQDKFKDIGMISRGLRHITNESTSHYILYLMLAEELVVNPLIVSEKRPTRWVKGHERQAYGSLYEYRNLTRVYEHLYNYCEKYGDLLHAMMPDYQGTIPPEFTLQGIANKYLIALSCCLRVKNFGKAGREINRDDQDDILYAIKKIMLDNSFYQVPFGQFLVTCNSNLLRYVGNLLTQISHCTVKANDQKTFFIDFFKELLKTEKQKVGSSEELVRLKEQLQQKQEDEKYLREKLDTQKKYLEDNHTKFREVSEQHTEKLNTHHQNLLLLLDQYKSLNTFDLYQVLNECPENSEDPVSAMHKQLQRFNTNRGEFLQNHEKYLEGREKYKDTINDVMSEIEQLKASIRQIEKTLVDSLGDLEKRVEFLKSSITSVSRSSKKHKTETKVSGVDQEKKGSPSKSIGKRKREEDVEVSKRQVKKYRTINKN